MSTTVMSMSICVAPQPMVEAVRGWLAEQGITPANFYYEKFSPSGAVTTIGETHRQAA